MYDWQESVRFDEHMQMLSVREPRAAKVVWILHVAFGPLAIESFIVLVPDVRFAEAVDPKFSRVHITLGHPEAK